MKLLLISNSTNAGEEYLAYCKQSIADFLHAAQVRKVLFIPYAAVTFSYDDYRKKVEDRLLPLGIEVDSVHLHADPCRAVAGAQAIMVGGGNTFHLLKHIQSQGLTAAIRTRVQQGAPYVGWSAGSNLTCPTICTTNDMPIVEPESFRALGLIPFQINPHYLDAHPSGHAGETREQRIEEFLAANQQTYVAGLREACMFYVENNRLHLHGNRPLRVFKYGTAPREYHAGDNLQFLL